MLFGCYRRTDAADPDGYVAGIAIVLTLYPDELIREVTDPRTGIMNDERYMSVIPNTGQLKVYCEAIQARQARFERLGSLGKPVPESHRLEAPEPRPGDLATVFVGANHPRYAEFCEWAKTADTRKWRYGKFDDGRSGIWVSYDAAEKGGGSLRKLGDIKTEAA